MRVPLRISENEAVSVGDNTLGQVALGPEFERGRLRMKSDVAGTLKFRYLKPDGTEYEENPADVSVLAADETVVEFPSLWGERVLRFIFNVAAAGTVEYADWSAVSYIR